MPKIKLALEPKINTKFVCVSNCQIVRRTFIQVHHPRKISMFSPRHLKLPSASSSCRTWTKLSRVRNATAALAKESLRKSSSQNESSSNGRPTRFLSLLVKGDSFMRWLSPWLTDKRCTLLWQTRSRARRPAGVALKYRSTTTCMCKLRKCKSWDQHSLNIRCATWKSTITEVRAWTWIAGSPPARYCVGCLTRIHIQGTSESTKEVSMIIMWLTHPSQPPKNGSKPTTRQA
mmetsp:Transcript_19478/g.56616  ORF Transcript_19478/g.56616 Transcript_19478/m.56616 type:complete len:232 (+) Transcript_19478:508-1203(+)